MLIRVTPMVLPPLKAISGFDAVARLGSISKAAVELNLTVSAVSHQMAKLEAVVGCKLFERSPRGLTLTAAGERYQRDRAGALALLASATQNARSAAGIKVLRIHAPPTFAGLWLMPRLPAFRALHPDIRVQLSAAHTYSDFSRGEVDIDIRYGAVGWSDLHVETLFIEEVTPMMSPHLKDRLQIRRPADLLRQELIYSDINLVQWPRWFAAHGVPLSPSSYALRFDRTSMVIDAAVQGLGIALDSSRMAAAALRRGDLVPVFADKKAILVHAHHLVYPMLHGRWDRVAQFVEWIRAEAAVDSDSPMK